jgi:hypothetical protein
MTKPNNGGAGNTRLSMYGNCNARGGPRPNSGPKPQWSGFRELIDSGELNPKRPGVGQIRGKGPGYAQRASS